MAKRPKRPKRGAADHARAKSGPAPAPRHQSRLDVSTRGRLLVAAVIVLMLGAYAVMARWRPVDGDEGIYLAAYSEVSRGQRLYLDFGYPQFPAMPYISAAWLALVSGPDPVGLRLLSVMWCGATALLLAAWARSRAMSFGAVALLLFLWAGNSLSVAWLPTIKSYALSVALSVGSFVCLSRGEADRWSRRFPVLLGGVLAGLCASTRLFYAVCVPLAIIWIWRDARTDLGRRAAMRPVLWFVAGAVIGAIPLWIFMALDFEALWFNTVTTHALRNDLNTTVADWTQKGDVAFELALHVQVLVLLAGCLMSALAARGSRPGAPALARLWAVGLGVMSILPTPSFTQYFVTLIPLLVAGAAPMLARLVEAARENRKVLAFVVLAAVCYAGILPHDAWTRDIEPIAGVWGPETVGEWYRISDAIARRTEVDDTILAWWPGFAPVAGRRNVAGMENSFYYMTSSKMTPEQIRRYHVVDEAAARTLIEGARPGVILLRRQFYLPDSAALRPLVRSRYVLDRVIGDFEIYARAKAAQGAGQRG